VCGGNITETRSSVTVDVCLIYYLEIVFIIVN